MGGVSGGAVPAIDLGEMSSAFPLRDVERILEETNRTRRRKRKLPAYLMTYYVTRPPSSQSSLPSRSNGKSVLSSSPHDRIVPSTPLPWHRRSP
jgi:hypothetical protein